MNYNPFDQIFAELNFIKTFLQLSQKAAKEEPQLLSEPHINKIPIKEIFLKKMMSKGTFYSHVRSGKITLYKLGNRSYVDRVEFEQAFKKVMIGGAVK
jgi:hypothetical protein